jgi:hypothetical protein
MYTWLDIKHVSKRIERLRLWNMCFNYKGPAWENQYYLVKDVERGLTFENIVFSYCGKDGASLLSFLEDQEKGFDIEQFLLEEDIRIARHVQWYNEQCEYFKPFAEAPYKVF